MKIGILYICIGKYKIFWKDFYESCQKNFLPGTEKQYFVFTDSPDVDFEKENPAIHRIYQKDLGWPGNTMMRFDMFLNIQGELKKFDYLIYFNSNLIFLEPIRAEDFLPTYPEKLIACLHPGYFNKTQRKFPYDRNPSSQAFIPIGQGVHYYAGGINGGRTLDFIAAIKEISKNIHADEERGVVAKWHDESHWNKYLLDRKDIKSLSPSYLYPEPEMGRLKIRPIIFLLDKKRYGGHFFLRNEQNVPVFSPSLQAENLRIDFRKFNKVVIWGLRTKYHTHRYIHKSFFRTLKKCKIPVVWVEDEKVNADSIEPNDLIISAEPVGRFVPEKKVLSDYALPVRDDVYYCLHNYKNIFLNQLSKNKILKLQVYSNLAHGEKWNEATFFNKEERTLYQPWGTDLLPHSFKNPSFSKFRISFWIGSVWDNALHQGNIEAINELKKVLIKHHIRFIRLRFVPEWLAIFLIRLSRIAPAIAGKFQTDINYLPCRVFKNISYGQLGITNVKKFKDILGDAFIDGQSITEILEKALHIKEPEFKKLVARQQEAIKKFTYVGSLTNIARAMALISDLK